jgi:pimeloyl-ACP methyl ester carboxylesterase
MSIQPYQELDWRSRDSLRLYARDYAAAASSDARSRCPVICIPGLTRNSADFHEIARVIAAGGRRVLAVDLRGRARSQHAARASSYSASNYAADILELMRTQAIPRAVFIGTSLGVIVTITVASKRVDAVAAAILNDAGPEVSRAALKRITSYAGKPVPPMTRTDATAYIERIGKVAYPRYTQTDWSGMVDRLFRVRDDGLLVLDYDPAIVRTASPFLLRLLRPLLWHAYRKLATRRPVLILRGELSDVLDADIARHMAAVSSDVCLVEVAGVGHAPDLSEPDARTAILAFLERVD